MDFQERGGSRSLHLKTGWGLSKEEKKKLLKRNLPALAVRSVGLEENASTAGKKRQGLAGGIGVSFIVTCPRKKTCRHRRSQLSVIFGGELSRPVSCLVHPHKCNPCPPPPVVSVVSSSLFFTIVSPQRPATAFAVSGHCDRRQTSAQWTAIIAYLNP